MPDIPVINASIVLHNNNYESIKSIVSTISHVEHLLHLYLIDDSLDDELKSLESLDKRIIYRHLSKNVGFGKAHNIALKKSIEDDVKYHVILNPDISFEPEVVREIYDFMEINSDVSVLMPRVLFRDGSLQYLCKLLPTPFDLFARRFLGFGLLNGLVSKWNSEYELRFTTYHRLMNVPSLSGCFLFFRTASLDKVGLFDPRYFMYMEDVDLTRRLHKYFKTMYFPDVEIYHDFERASYKNFNMLVHHTVSAIRYFNKWGWLFDEERRMVNKETVQQLKATGA